MKGITIAWPEGDAVEHIPPDRKMFIVWHDQFGTPHTVAWGGVDMDSDRYDEVMAAVVYDLFGGRAAAHRGGPRMTEQDVPDAPDDDVPQPANDPVEEPGDDAATSPEPVTEGDQ